MAGEATPNAGTPAPNTPAAGVQGSASGPGSSGVGGGSGAPAPTPAVTQPPPTPSPAAGQPGFNAASSPATQAAGQAGQPGGAAPTSIVPPQPAPLDFDAEYQRRYGVHPSQGQLLLQMGYQAYQRTGQPAPAAAGPAAPAKHPWGIPQFDQRLLQFVERDPSSGQLRVLPGGPPDAAVKVQEYRDACQAAHQKLLENPAEALREIVLPMAQQVAQQMMQQHMGQYQAQTTVQGIFNDNQGWLFAKAADGSVQHQFDMASGQHRPVLSPAGRYYAQRVQELDRAGLKDPAMQHKLALGQLREALLAAQAQQAAAPAAGQQANAAFLAGAAAGTAGNPAPAPTPTAAAPGAALTTSTLRDVMRQRLDAAGVTDDVIRNAR